MKMAPSSNTDADEGVSSLQDDTKYDFRTVPAQALDAVRMRLAQLTHSLAKIRDEMSRTELPQWYSVQVQVNVILTQLLSLTTTINHFEETLDSIVVYPLPNFPTTAHESLLTTLLRKKNIPEVDEWINDANDTAAIDSAYIGEDEIEKMLQNDENVTKWALEFLGQERGNYAFHGLSTAKQLEQGIGVRTGDGYSAISSSHKPRKPFDVDGVLKYLHKGAA